MANTLFVVVALLAVLVVPTTVHQVTGWWMNRGVEQYSPARMWVHPGVVWFVIPVVVAFVAAFLLIRSEKRQAAA